MEEGEAGKRKPEGGFKFISVGQLCMVWSAYREHRIRFLDLRAYFACHEVEARRCILPKGDTPDYRIEEVSRLLGRGGEDSTRAALRRLEGEGLLTFAQAKLSFAASPEQLTWNNLDGFWAMFNRITNNRRRVPVPRRILRLIAGGARQVVVATILGHLLRCLYYRNELCEPVGSVKASWVAEVFGVDERNVKGARGHLETIGWLFPRRSPQWHQNRYGKTVAVNLEWTSPKALETQAAVDLESPPRPPEIPVGSPPPDSSDLELSSRSKNQKPAVPAETPGFSTKAPTVEKPSLARVVPEDLKDTGRLLQLFEEATKRKLLPDTERDRLNFVAAAEHARVIGTKNPCGLFAWLVRRRKWEFITEGDDEAAHRRIKVHLFGDPKDRMKAPVVPSAHRPLSEDAKFAQQVQRVLRQQLYTGDAYDVVAKARPDWTRERWSAAVKEMEDATLRERLDLKTIGHAVESLLGAVGAGSAKIA